MNYLITICIVLLLTPLVQAQTLEGTVKDTQNFTIPSAIVSIYTPDKVTLIKATISNANGQFRISNLENGSYVLTIKSMGFKPFTSATFTINKTSKVFETIVLEEATETLDEVVITAEKPMIQVLADKTVFNVDANISATGDSALELLRKAPGVIVDNNDTIIVEGKAGVLVYIDDKPSVLRGDDLVNYLKTLQSTAIEAIEIITQPSSKYDAEGSAGIINIKFKRDKGLGTNGSLATGVTYGDFARFNNSVSFNNRNKKTSLYGSFSNGFGKSTGFLNLFRTQSNTIFDARSESVFDANNNNARFGFDFYATETSTFGIILNGNFTDNTNNSSSRTPIIPEGNTIPDEVLIAESNTKTKTNNLYTNINYKYKTKEDVLINIDIDFGKYTNNRTNRQPNRYFNGTETTLLSETTNVMVTPIEIKLFTTKFDFEHPLLKGKLALGVKYASINTDNNFNFFNRLNGQDVLNESRTNAFNYNETVSAVYFNFNKAYKSITVQMGLRAEQTQSKGTLSGTQNNQDNVVKRNYTDWFPSGGITYKWNAKNTFALLYSKRIARPNYRSLNPFEYNTDELSFRKGNPFLQPQYTDNIKLSHTFNYRLNTSLSYSFIKDFSAQVTEAVGDDQNFIITRNVANQKIINLGISYPTALNDWWRIYASVNAYRSIYEATNPDFISTEQNTLNLYAQNTFSLPKGYTVEVSGWYSSPSVWGGTYRTKSLGSLNVAFQKKFMDDKLTARLALNDILFTSPWRGDTQFGDLFIDGSGGSDSRQLRINLSYNFGSNTVKKARQRDTGIENEKNRI